MNELLRKANAVARQRHNLTALQIEEALIALGFHSISFPKRGPIRVRYLGVEYELET